MALEEQIKEIAEGLKGTLGVAVKPVMTFSSWPASSRFL